MHLLPLDLGAVVYIAGPMGATFENLAVGGSHGILGVQFGLVELGLSHSEQPLTQPMPVPWQPILLLDSN